MVVFAVQPDGLLLGQVQVPLEILVYEIGHEVMDFGACEVVSLCLSYGDGKMLALWVKTVIDVTTSVVRKQRPQSQKRVLTRRRLW